MVINWVLDPLLSIKTNIRLLTFVNFDNILPLFCFDSVTDADMVTVLM